MRMHRTLLPALIVAAALLCLAPPPTSPARATASQDATLQADGPLAFPPGFMKSIKDYGAKGDGATDDTAAIQRALNEDRVDASGNPLYPSPDDYNGRPKALFFPAGVYLVSTTVSWVGCCLSIQGQGSGATTIRLKDRAAGFNDAANARPVIKTEGGNESFRQNIRDLTVDIGSGNPGAAGIDYISNNSGALQNVVIRSGDGQGATGLDMRRSWPGPCLIKNVRIEGFDYGIQVVSGEYGPTFEEITLLGQRVAGLRNVYGVLAMRGLHSVNSVPAIVGAHPVGLIALLDADLRGGSGAVSAIQSEGQLYARNVVAAGYRSAVAYKGAVVPGLTQSEYFTNNYQLFDSPARSLNLPIQETPEYRDDDLGNWGAFQPREYGDTSGLQALLNSGKSTIYFPFGVYFSFNERAVTVPPTVKRIVGFSSVVNTDSRGTNGGGIRFVVQDASADPLIIEGFGYGVKVENRSARTLVVKHTFLYGYTDAPGAGDLFLEDVQLEPATFTHTRRVWARQLNAEGPISKVNNNGADLWILGLKTEVKNTVIRTSNGARTELIGTAIMPLGVGSGDKTIPAFIIDNASASLIYRRLVYDDATDFDIQIAETRGGETRRALSKDWPREVTLFSGFAESAATNAPPSVALTSPAAGARLAAGAAVALRAEAADSDGNVASVAFYADDVKVGEDNVAPYCVAWVPGGAAAALTARASDNAGATTRSAPVAVTVSGGTGARRVYLPLVRGGSGGVVGSPAPCA